MTFPYFMRHDNPLVISFLCINIIQNNIFISGPSTSTDHGPPVITESLHLFNSLCRISNLLYPVKTSVPCLLHVSDANRRQQLHGFFILHEKTSKEPEHTTMKIPPFLEEWLLRTENSRNQIRLYLMFMQFIQIIIPVFVFHKHGSIRFPHFHKMTCIRRGIYR